MSGQGNRPVRWSGGVGVLLIFAAVACAAPASSPAREADKRSPVESQAQTTLRLASLREPVQGLAPPGGTQFGDRTSIAFAFHAGLSIYDSQGALQPHIALKVPSLADGDWVVLPDGRMELTWRLRPDVRWHDGTPLTAGDFVLGIQIVQDAEMPLFRGQVNQALDDAVALDPLTLLVRWKEPNFLANSAGPMDPIAVPVHLVGALYEKRDIQAFINSPYWTSEFVGLGPFKLSEWVLGSHTEAVAYDRFFLGKPKIDRLIIRYFTDLNAMVASLMAREVDVIPAGTIKIEEVMTIRSAWDPTGGGTVLQSRAEIESIRVQFRYPSAPWAQDVRVRRAMAHATDRQALVDALLYGTTTVADLFVAPGDPVYRRVEAQGFPKYGYDPAEAERLLGEAGWVRSGAGLANASGEPFAIELRAVANSEYNTRQALAITDQWKNARLGPTLNIIQPALSNREELKATPNGIYWIPNQLVPNVLEIFTSGQTSSEQSRWRGQNYGAYANPNYDRLFARFTNTMEDQPRQEIQAQLLRLAAEELPAIPTLYAVNYATAFRSGVRGPGPIPPAQLVSTWNIYAWEMD